ncbi:BAR-domain-containing protein [Ramicandelaber brevisporus]|nr:BAR-domain-containing protein [Ramicandelaber brevisporus]KAI8870995.1 BAR-domain-containing protein [Ramicandelaber brevisporus]
MDSFRAFSSQMAPFTEKLTRSFTQVKQMASESMGTAEDITQLPADYINLEKRFETVRSVHGILIKMANLYTTNTTIDAGQLGDAVSEYSRSLGNTLSSQFQTVKARVQNQPVSEGARSVADADPDAIPNTVPHHLARASLKGSDALTLEEPLGAGLFKFGAIMEKAGDAKVKMDARIKEKTIDQLTNSLGAAIKLAQTSRGNLKSSRLMLDAVKADYKNAKPEKANELRIEVELAEDKFVGAVEETMTLMKNVVDSPEALRCLSEFVSAQTEYYVTVAGLLTELSPEMEEMYRTQETIFTTSGGIRR